MSQTIDPALAGLPNVALKTSKTTATPGGRSAAKPPKPAPAGEAVPGVEAEMLRVEAVADAGEWERLAGKHPMASIFTAWGWGKYKEGTGWSAVRLKVEGADGRLVGLCSVAIRRKLGVRVFHVQGGPLLMNDDDELGARVLMAIVGHLAPGPFDVVAISTYYFRTDALVMGLLSSGFCPVLNRVDYTLMLDLSKGIESVRAGISRRWKRALKTSGSSLRVRFPEDAESRRAAVGRFGPMYESLARRKRFEARTSIPELAEFVANDPRFVVLEILDGEEVVAIRIAHVAGEFMTDFLAATTESAMRSSAGYVAMWSLVERAAAMGCKRLDCGGIDPFSNPGVFRFKRGICQAVRQSEPVWIWSRSTMLRRAVQAFLTWS
jgi:hypothetical protein